MTNSVVTTYFKGLYYFSFYIIYQVKIYLLVFKMTQEQEYFSNFFYRFDKMFLKLFFYCLLILILIL